VRSVEAAKDVCECVEIRLRWLSRVIHAGGGDVVGRSWEERNFETDEGPATSASQVLFGVLKHSEIRHMIVDTVFGDGAIVCTVVVFRCAKMRNGGESKKTVT